jgi:hypothetical protein
MKSSGVLIALCLFAAVSLAQAPQSSFRGGPSHLGIYNSAAPNHLSLKWAFPTNGAIVSSPAVAAGVVYAGSADGGLYAVEAVTGKLRWRFDAHGGVNSSPAVDGSTVYAVSLDGNLYAVDTATGKQRWAFATQGEHRFTAPGVLGTHPSAEIMPDPWDFYTSSPTVAVGIVYFGSGDGNIYAVDASTGVLRWSFKTGDVVHSSPTISGGILYAGSWDTYFYALNAATGELKWKFKTGDDPNIHLMTGIPGSAAVANGAVYFGSRDANFYALDAATGALKWKVPNDGSWVIASRSRYNKTVTELVQIAPALKTPAPKPEWLKARAPVGENYHSLKQLARSLQLNTVCESAHCPNIGECWHHKTATFMMLGNLCTRRCGFCAVPKGRPSPSTSTSPAASPRPWPRSASNTPSSPASTATTICSAARAPSPWSSKRFAARPPAAAPRSSSPTFRATAKPSASSSMPGPTCSTTTPNPSRASIAWSAPARATSAL